MPSTPAPRFNQHASRCYETETAGKVNRVLARDITNPAKSCQSCTQKHPSLPREPLIQHQAATGLFEQLHFDLDTINGRDFLIISDQYSGWPDVIPFSNKNTTARRVVDGVREFFIRGPRAPVKFWNDNEHQINAVEFKDFARDWGI
jgi:hypothetical protein